MAASRAGLSGIGKHDAVAITKAFGQENAVAEMTGSRAIEAGRAAHDLAAISIQSLGPKPRR